MVRFFVGEYPCVFGLASDDPGLGGGNDGGNLVADFHLHDHVLHVIVDGSLAQAEDPRGFIGRLAGGAQLEDLDLPRREVGLAAFLRARRQAAGEHFAEVAGDVEHVAKVLVQLHCTDFAVRSGQAENASQATLLMVERL